MNEESVQHPYKGLPFRLTKEGNSYSLSVNQTVVASDTSNNGGVPSIYLSARAEMQFNNLKLKRFNNYG